jgi:hypothetical protein
MARSWYAYKGSGDPYLSSSYTLMTVCPACINGNNLCAIFVYDGGIIPIGPFSMNIRRYISNFLAPGLAQPYNPVNAKKYVLGKTQV